MKQRIHSVCYIHVCCVILHQVAERVERRLRMIQSEMDADRAVSGRYEELSNLSMELRNVKSYALTSYIVKLCHDWWTYILS